MSNAEEFAKDPQYFVLEIDDPLFVGLQTSGGNQKFKVQIPKDRVKVLIEDYEKWKIENDEDVGFLERASELESWIDDLQKRIQCIEKFMVDNFVKDKDTKATTPDMELLDFKKDLDDQGVPHTGRVIHISPNFDKRICKAWNDKHGFEGDKKINSFHSAKFFGLEILVDINQKQSFVLQEGK